MLSRGVRLAFPLLICSFSVAYADRSDPCDPRYHWIVTSNCATIGQQISSAISDLRRGIAEQNALLAAARRQFWATYPDKPGSAKAKDEFWMRLYAKDFYYLYVALSSGQDKRGITQRERDDLGRRIFDTLGGKLDNGIPQSAVPEFYEWVADVRRNLGGDPFQNMTKATNADFLKMLNFPTNLLKAMADSGDKYDIYVRQRDWAEFDAAKREPPGFGDPANYFVGSSTRFQELSPEDALSEYNGMVKALGAEVVRRSIQQVYAAPKGDRGLLLVTVADPVRRTPSGNLIEDETVPMPDAVIGSVALPIKAIERLATKDDDRRYALWIFTDTNRPSGIPRFNPATKWQFAETTYHRYALAFGEPALLQASNKIRTAPKRMTTGGLMNSDAIGATRGNLWPALDEVLVRRDPRGYVRCVLAFSRGLDTAPDVDAAYRQFISSGNEAAVLDAARGMAAGRPYPMTDHDLNLLTNVLGGAQTLKKEPEAMIDFPQYLAWKGFSAGAKATYAYRALKPGGPGSSRMIPSQITIRETYRLESINEQRAQVWLTETAYDFPTGRAHPPRDTEQTYPAKIARRSDQAPAPNDSGQESIDINGRTLPTRWQSTSGPFGNCRVTTTVWNSDEVPGALVRKLVRTDCAGSPPGVTETILESFDGASAGRPEGIQRSRQGPATTPLPPAPSTDQLGELRQRYSMLNGRAARAKNEVARIETGLERQGRALRADIREARYTVTVGLDDAAAAIARGDIIQAGQQLKSAELAISVLEKFIGL